MSRSMVLLSVLALGIARAALPARNFLYQNASPCFNFSGDGFANKTRCEIGVIPGTYASWTAPRTGRDSLLYGTTEAQQAIYQHQHPADCRNATFLVVHFKAYGHGLGSTIHMMSFGLTMAIRLGRVFIHGGGGDSWAHDNKFCESASLLDECLLQPMSSCSLEDVMRGEAAPFTYDLDPASWPTHRVLQAKTTGNYRLIPPTFQQLLVNSPISMAGKGPTDCALPLPHPAKGDREGFAVQWWRAQSSAYVYRPVPRLLHAIRNHAKEILQAVNGTVPPGTIGVHVRRGDKERESKDITDAEYLSRVEALHAASAAAGAPLQRTIFLSTEDTVTLSVFKSWANWTVLHTDVPRHHEKISPMKFASKMGIGEVVLNDLVSLELALQCDAWVGSLSSNWVRLIHELRATTRCKADNLFFDSRFGLNFTYTSSIPALYR
ncbi:hypothetical protein TSOC_009049 [Tetrabaena socialis]|uniref:Uncharacterized protein n=1 Tax=Tetrabaena socialis TaxID=47790 RepID=A0A2J7ZWV6_9CHLO|nr:hypothetical protein TSOC_009049 [Tetrabaena socialis]|eukprot:PNH04725.1 hypothetical protein TSOC_009049 [Tetrabaena socialis]